MERGESQPSEESQVSIKEFTLEKESTAPLDYIANQHSLDIELITQKVFEERERFKLAIEKYRGTNEKVTIKLQLIS